jgi:hypothetical protein
MHWEEVSTICQLLGAGTVHSAGIELERGVARRPYHRATAKNQRWLK